MGPFANEAKVIPQSVAHESILKDFQSILLNFFFPPKVNSTQCFSNYCDRGYFFCVNRI